MSDQKVIAYIGVGSNLSPQINIKQALLLLKQAVCINKTSNFYKTKPLANKKQNDFINGVWEITTHHSAQDLKFTILRNIEQQLNRQRTQDKYAARTIDLDLLLYGNAVINKNGLCIPDKDIYMRPFIYFPLFELNPKLVLPDSGTHIKKLCQKTNTMQAENEFTQTLKALLD